MNRYLSLAAFSAGLAAVSWVGFGYIGSNPLALGVTLLVGVFYVLGALELRGFDRATASLRKALADLSGDLPGLGEWLDRLHPSLQNPVRLRIEGERIGLPGPAMTPYLVGLLVLLGMLGTFLGMVVTLNGAVIALESTTDLQAVRASLAAPVKGLGVAFGTSVAGVCASAMLGLMSALCRRERLQAGQLLDTGIATRLRVFSLAHQRQETFKALQDQARVMPEVVDKLQAMMAQMERQAQALSGQWLAGQENFHRQAEAVYSGLAASVDRSLKESLTESARLAGATIQPVVEATMAGMARESALVHERMAGTVKTQLDGMSERFAGTVAGVSETWKEALAQQQRGSESLAETSKASLTAFARTLERNSAALLASVGQAHGEWQAESVSRDEQRLAAWTASLESMAQSLQREWQQAGALAARQQEQICTTLEQAARGITEQAEAQARSTIAEIARLMQAASRLSEGSQESLAAFAKTFEQQSATLLATVDRAHGALLAESASRDEQRLAAWTGSLEAMAATLQQEWQQAGALASRQQEQICATLEQTARGITEQAETQARSTIAEIARLMQAASRLSEGSQESLAAFARTFEQQSATLLATVDKAHGDLLAASATSEQQRLAAWTQSLEAMAAALQREWQQAGALTLRQQEQICSTLDQTARGITAQAEAHARSTIAEMAGLMQAATEAPRAAAEVIAQLRQKLSDSLARDNELLEERSRIMATVGALLDAVNQACSGQRESIDALVGSSAALLERVSAGFTEKIEAQTGTMADVAAQISGSAVEVASLGEAFGLGVQLFSESNDKLVAHLQRIEASLTNAMSRSDEQLAYYVAQAREIIDLSIMSQKQIVDDLQQLKLSQAPLAEEA